MKPSLPFSRSSPWVMVLLGCSLTANVFLLLDPRTQPSPAGESPRAVAGLEPAERTESNPATGPAVGTSVFTGPAGRPGQALAARPAIPTAPRARLSELPSRPVTASLPPAAGLPVVDSSVPRPAVPSPGGPILDRSVDPAAGAGMAPDEAAMAASALTTPPTALAAPPAYAGADRAPAAGGTAATMPRDERQLATAGSAASGVAREIPGGPPATSRAVNADPPTGVAQPADLSTYEQNVSRAAEAYSEALVAASAAARTTPSAGWGAPSSPVSSLRAWVESEQRRRAWSQELRLLRRAAIAAANPGITSPRP